MFEVEIRYEGTSFGFFAATIMASAGGLSKLANLSPTQLLDGYKMKKSSVGGLVDCFEKTEIVLNTY